MLLNRVPCWANESMLGVRMRRYPYALKWSARRVSIEIRMTEVGSAARHNPALIPSNVNRRNHLEHNHQPPATNHQPRRAMLATLRLRNLLPRVHKRHRHNHRARRAVGRLDFKLRAHRRVRRRRHRVADVLLQSWRIDGRSHSTHYLAIFAHGPGGHVELDRRALNLDPNQAPSISTPTKPRFTPSARTRRSASRPRTSASLSRSTSRSRPASYGLVSSVISTPWFRMPPSMRRISLGPVGRILKGRPASMMRSHKSSPRLPSRR